MLYVCAVPCRVRDECSLAFSEITKAADVTKVGSRKNVNEIYDIHVYFDFVVGCMLFTVSFYNYTSFQFTSL